MAFLYGLARVPQVHAHAADAQRCLAMKGELNLLQVSGDADDT